MNETAPDTIVYPYIVFTVKGHTYCVNSQYVISIEKKPERYQEVTDAPACITGMFSHQGEIYHLFDVRTAFGFPTMDEEIQSFADMIEQRKQDHRNWVEALERSVNTGCPFTLATDPHCCAFGKWYYKTWNSNTVDHSVNFVLGKIEEPHRKLHESALCLTDKRQDLEHDPHHVLKTVKQEQMPRLLNLLDDVIAAFQAELSRELVLLVNDGKLRAGLVVDEVLAVENLELLSTGCGPLSNVNQNCFTCVRTSEKLKQHLILEIDLQKLLIPYALSLETGDGSAVKR